MDCECLHALSMIYTVMYSDMMWPRMGSTEAALPRCFRMVEISFLLFFYGDYFYYFILKTYHFRGTPRLLFGGTQERRSGTSTVLQTRWTVRMRLRLGRRIGVPVWETTYATECDVLLLRDWMHASLDFVQN